MLEIHVGLTVGEWNLDFWSCISLYKVCSVTNFYTVPVMGIFLHKVYMLFYHWAQNI